MNLIEAIIAAAIFGGVAILGIEAGADALQEAKQTAGLAGVPSQEQLDRLGLDPAADNKALAEGIRNRAAAVQEAQEIFAEVEGR